MTGLARMLGMAALSGACLAVAVPGAAQLYHVTDEAGRTVVTNARPASGAAPAGAGGRLAVAALGPARAAIRAPVRDPRADTYRSHVASAAARHMLSPRLIEAVIAVESNFEPRAVSRAGAQGLMQLMPDTARELDVADPFDPAQNIHGGARYLRKLLDLFGQDLTLALAAYNAGPAAVQAVGGVPFLRETRDYVRKVKARLGADTLVIGSNGLDLVRTGDGRVKLTNRRPAAAGSKVRVVWDARGVPTITNH